MATTDHSRVPKPATRRVTLPSTVNEVGEVTMPLAQLVRIGSPLSAIKFALGVTGLADGDAAIGDDYQTVAAGAWVEVDLVSAHGVARGGSLYISSPTTLAEVELVYS